LEYGDYMYDEYEWFSDEDTQPPGEYCSVLFRHFTEKFVVI